MGCYSLGTFRFIETATRIIVIESKILLCAKTVVFLTIIFYTFLQIYHIIFIFIITFDDLLHDQGV